MKTSLIIHATETERMNAAVKELFSTCASVNGYQIYIDENGDIVFKEPENFAKYFRGFNGAKSVFATEDNRFFIFTKSGSLYVFGNNDKGQIERKTKEVLYSSEKEVFKYTWDPYFEHPGIVYETTEQGRRPVRFWNEEDTENYMKEKFFDANFHLKDRDVYLKYTEACKKYGEKNIKRDIIFDVDFNTTVYRDGDYYRQDFEGFRSHIIYRTNDFIYEPVKVTGEPDF